MLNQRPEKEEDILNERLPIFVQPLSAPIECDSGDRVHFNARYEPIDDNQLLVKWFLNNRPLLTGSRIKTINEFGYVVLEVSYNYLIKKFIKFIIAKKYKNVYSFRYFLFIQKTQVIMFVKQLMLLVRL